MLNTILMPMLKFHRHSYLLVFKLLCAQFYCGMASKSVLFQQESATYATYIRYIHELHPVKAFIYF